MQRFAHLCIYIVEEKTTSKKTGKTCEAVSEGESVNFGLHKEADVKQKK